MVFHQAEWAKWVDCGSSVVGLHFPSKKIEAKLRKTFHLAGARWAEGKSGTGR